MRKAFISVMCLMIVFIAGCDDNKSKNNAGAKKN